MIAKKEAREQSASDDRSLFAPWNGRVYSSAMDPGVA